MRQKTAGPSSLIPLSGSQGVTELYYCSRNELVGPLSGPCFWTCFILVNTSAPHTLYNTQSDFLKCVSDHITPLQRLPTEHKVNAQVLTVAPRVLNHMVWSCFSTCHLPIFPNRPALSGSFLSQCLHIYLPLLAWAVCSSLQKAWS